LKNLKLDGGDKMFTPSTNSLYKTCAMSTFYESMKKGLYSPLQKPTLEPFSESLRECIDSYFRGLQRQATLGGNFYLARVCRPFGQKSLNPVLQKMTCTWKNPTNVNNLLVRIKKIRLTSSSGDGVGPIPFIRLFSLAV
jgi:hypothetical protein